MSSIVTDLADVAGKFLDEALAFGLGFALGAALEPASAGIRQNAWGDFPNLVVDPKMAAAIVAEDVEKTPWGANEAKQGGIDGDRFAAIVGETLNAPGFGELLRMLRRGAINPDDFAHGLRKSKWEPRWDAAAAAMEQERLEPGEIAKAIHRGIMAGAGLLLVSPPTTPGQVEAVPPSPLDPIAEAAAAGVDAERLRILVGNAGLPPGPVQMLQLLNRGRIDESDFLRGVGESNLRNEWGQALLALRRHLLTPHEYEEAALRGVISNEAADAGAALSGMEQADAQLLFEIMGRPLAVHQITTGLARGGDYGGTYDDVPEPYRDAIRRSNIRPEYARLAHANRYSIPSYFILRAILQDGGMTTADFAQYGKELGWPPDLAEKAAAAIAGGATAKSDPHIAKAQTQLWNTIHKSYVASESTEQEARATLAALEVAAGAQDAVIALWNHERALVRNGLTPTQIKKAIGQPGKDRAWAIARLLELGYDQADAETFLSE